MKKAIIFDMDGVLVDVSDSYLRTIKKVFHFFTRRNISSAEIQEFRNKGGLNNDWDLTWRLINEAGKNVPHEKVVPLFQKIYRGENFDGLILKEKWLLKKEIMEKLREKMETAIVTGRPGEEALFSLEYFSAKEYFPVVLTRDDIPKGKEKPHPWGLRSAMKILGTNEGFYAGDTVDDIEASLRAGLAPVGIVPPGCFSEKQKQIFLNRGASFVLNDINKILEILK